MEQVLQLGSDHVKYSGSMIHPDGVSCQNQQNGNIAVNDVMEDFFSFIFINCYYL